MVLATLAGPWPISTHALREEGDDTKGGYVAIHLIFLPTPSARRATLTVLL